jgi:spiro-SPASM protein
MKTAVVINALLMPEDWTKAAGQQDPVDLLLQKAEKLVKRDDIYIVADDRVIKKLGNRWSKFTTVVPTVRKTASVFEQVYREVNSYDDAIYFFLDTPLIDIDVTRQMTTLHQVEIAEYTYGEGFPLGYAPEIVKISLLPKLISLLLTDQSEIGRDSLFSTLSKEINSFDIETYFAPRDMKLKRIELTLSPKRNSLLTQRVIEIGGGDCSYERFCQIIEEQPALIRTVPSYVEFEITNKTNSTCIYSPIPILKRSAAQLEFENFKLIFDKLREFSEDFYTSFSYIGEPLLHNDLKRFVEYSIENPGVKLILETDGHLFTPDFSDYVSGLKAENLYLIFTVDAVREDTYAEIRGKGLKRVQRNIRYLLSKWDHNVYVQMVRMDVNEGEMLQFYDLWEKEGAHVIIQKYNSYLNLLTKRSESDLRPLDRQPCWHLTRDLVVFCNGDVPRCKQDINRDFNLGNLIDEDVATIWERNNEYYLQHCAGTYDKYCKVCDEWYTFNF